MIVLDETTVVVFTYQELKTVLEGNNLYNYIYFGNNIKLTSGINISSTKKNLTIDGTYNNVTYTFEDVNSSTTSNTISINSTNANKITVKNVNIVGHNYYGIIYVPDSNTYQNVIIEYNNISYTGPQISFHPSGLTRFINCNIIINSQEIAECNRIEIGGTTTINHTSTSDSAFWFRGSNQPYFKILENSIVNITITNRELFYGVNNLEFSVLSGATFILNSALGMAYGSYGTGNVLLDKNSTTKITQTKKNSSYPTWYCNGIFNINENASFYIINNYANISSNNYNIYFRTTSAALNINNPKEIVLYNEKANIIYSNSTIPFNITLNRINIWNVANKLDTAGSIDNLPNYSWYKSSGLFNITGNITNTTTNVITNDFSQDDLNKLPTLNNFMFQKPVISVGKINLTLCSVSDESLNLCGYTVLNADVLISYLNNNDIVSANTDGYFSYNLTSPLALGTNIKYIANKKNSFIYETREIQVKYSGELVLTNAPEKIQFKLSPISSLPILCPRLEDIKIIITDSRLESTNWKLYVKINHNLTSSNGYILTDSLVYVNDNKIVDILSNTPLLIYQGVNNQGETKITTISWEEDKGILLRIENEPIENNETYEAEITWILEE